MSRSTLAPACLALPVAGRGPTRPLAGIAVSEGHGPVGLVFRQRVPGAALPGGLTHLGARRPPLGRAHPRLCLVVALVGTLLPTASHAAAVHLPAGLLSTLPSLVPMLALPIALALGIDRVARPRLVGLFLVKPRSRAPLAAPAGAATLALSDGAKRRKGLTGC